VRLAANTAGTTDFTFGAIIRRSSKTVRPAVAFGRRHASLTVSGIVAHVVMVEYRCPILGAWEGA
jgi:hypothetical protein